MGVITQKVLIALLQEDNKSLDKYFTPTLHIAHSGPHHRERMQQNRIGSID